MLMQETQLLLFQDVILAHSHGHIVMATCGRRCQDSEALTSSCYRERERESCDVLVINLLGNSVDN